jgi:hypothetical protein
MMPGHGYIDTFVIHKSDEKDFKNQFKLYMQSTPFSLFKNESWFLEKFKKPLVHNTSHQIEWILTEKPKKEYENLWKTTMQKVLSTLNFSDAETFSQAKKNIIKNQDIKQDDFFLDFVKEINHTDYIRRIA